MKTRDKESVYSFLRRHNLLERVIGPDGGSERQRYPNKLILESDHLINTPDRGQEFFNLRSVAERAFASDHAWVFALQDGLTGPAADWERLRAQQLGQCFTWHFADIYEGLPLYVRAGSSFRSATAQDEAYSCVAQLLTGEWLDFAVYDDPPFWAASLFIRQSDLELHQQFFGDYGSWDDPKRVNAARELRKAAFHQALAVQRTNAAQKVLRRHLKPIIEALPQIKGILQLSGDQAIDFTAEAFTRLGLRLYVEHEHSGFWTPCLSDEHKQQLFSSLRSSDYATDFHNGDSRPRNKEEWETLCMAPDDFDTLIEDASRFANMPSRTASSPDSAPDSEPPKYLNRSHPNYSPKLAAAVAAWDALTGDPTVIGKRHPKSAAARWLEQNAARLGLLKSDGTINAQGIEDISKIVNWKPEGGAPKSGA